MRIKLDPESDALYIRFAERPIVESEEVSRGIILDFDDEGCVVGLEILGVSEKFSPDDLQSVQVEMPNFTKA
ncbi:MAG TPA: DUF2283 domain-containing protein [Candidatus Acetothermia bacterium]|nr:DUF2283 domain-containing protein [Candidatus Acetothermia bacterium]